MRRKNETACGHRYLKARNRGLFEPPSTEDTVEMPGNNGGANFGGVAVDPKHGYLYVVSKDLPTMLKLSLADSLSRTGSPPLRPLPSQLRAVPS